MEHVFQRDGINAVVVEATVFIAMTGLRCSSRSSRRIGKTVRLATLAQKAICLTGFGAVMVASGAWDCWRYYLHDPEEAKLLWTEAPGTFTPWMPAGSHLLFYEGLHGGVVTDRVNVSLC